MSTRSHDMSTVGGSIDMLSGAGDRFPADLKSQCVISSPDDSSSSPGQGGRRHLPYAITEQGVAMLSSVQYDGQFKVVFDAIRALMTPPDAKKKRAVGFGPPEGT
jgi:hypothetical protein